MGNQPSGWVAGPYIRAYAPVAYYFLDQDNPAAVTPNSCQLYQGVAHGEWQTLLDFTQMGGGGPLIRYYYGLVTGGGGGLHPPLQLSAWEQNEIMPSTFELIVEAPTQIPLYTFNWATTQTWIWQEIGRASLVLGGVLPSQMALWDPQSGSGTIPLDVTGVMLQYVRLRVTSPVGQQVNCAHELWTAVTGARNPINEHWVIIGREP